MNQFQDNIQSSPKELMPKLANWQIAYVARQLRKEKRVTLTCLENEAGFLMEQLNSFSNTNSLMSKTVNKPNSNEIFLEIVNF